MRSSPLAIPSAAPSAAPLAAPWAALAILLATAAPPIQAHAASEPQRAKLVFEAGEAGLHVMTLEVDMVLNPTAYRIDTMLRSTGVARLFHPGEQRTTAIGHWAGARAVPEYYASIGRWSDEPRRTVIVYAHGRPEVKEHVGPAEPVREPIAPALLDGASNQLSAMAELVHVTAQTGSCDLQMRTYDGRVLSSFVSRAEGSVDLDERAYTGSALRCGFAGYALAGLPRSASKQDRAKPVQQGTIWLGQVLPGFPRLPVQLSFETHWFGSVTAHLVSAGITAGTSLADPEPPS